jgi:transcriptional regulator with XRE-family HTH domain
MASFGENLRRERELRGVSLREIADATKISVRFLQALENDRLDQLPGGLFPRAFLRQYADHVGLDAERLVADFVFTHGGEPASERPVLAQPVRRGPRSRVPLVVGVVAAAAAALFAFKPQPPEPAVASEARVVHTPPVSVAEDRVYPAPAPEPAEEQVEQEGLVLTLSARETCWVAARVDGQTVLNRTLREGESETLAATGEIVLSVGNAGGLEFRVNELQGVPLGRQGEVRKNIVITKQSLPSLVGDARRARSSHSS